MPTYRWNACKFQKTGNISAWDDGIIWWDSLMISSEHMIHSAPSDITAVISMLVLIFLCRGQERKSAHSESSENYGEKLLTYFHYCFCDCHSWALTSKTSNGAIRALNFISGNLTINKLWCISSSII